MDSLKFIIKDIFRCIYIGFLISIGTAVLMVLVSLIFKQNILQTVYIALFSVGSFCMFVGGLSFLHPNTQRPLNYQADWERYFKKLNIGYVILFIGITIMLLAIMVYNISWSINYTV